MRITTESTEAQAYSIRVCVLPGHSITQRHGDRSWKPKGSIPIATCVSGAKPSYSGQNINDSMREDAVEPAFIAVSKAAALKERVTPKECALIVEASADPARAEKVADDLRGVKDAADDPPIEQRKRS